MLHSLIRVAAVAVVFAGAAGNAGANYGLLRDKDVQKDLKLTEEQAKKIDALLQKDKELIKNFLDKDLGGKDAGIKLKALAEAQGPIMKAINEILTKDQVKRLEQLTLQARGPLAFFDPKI